jgi:hypothetical protein
MLFSISISALVPWASDPLVGAASFSACNANKNAAV